MPVAQLTLMVSALVGWSDIKIEPARGEGPRSAFHRTAAAIDRPSERTHETLRRYDLDREYRRDVNGALIRLEKFARRRPEAELVYALAELSWLEGRHLDRSRKPQAIDRYLDAASYAYDYLFAPNPILAAGRGPSDPRFILACGIYNAGVERLIRAAQNRGNIEIQNGETIPFKVHGREQILRIVLDDAHSPWESTDIHRILLASDFEVTGLNRDFYQHGLGVPLVAIREPRTKKGETSPEERFYPAEMAFPLTAFVSLQSRLWQPKADGEETRECTLELIDPVQKPLREVGHVNIPLEADLTTPLAYMWSRTDLERYRWAGLLRPEKALERANLLLIRPYEPGKIPVVMVHGLISSPLAWIPMLNELLRDPLVQSKYQFLLYMYPTGVPIPIAAASLRESLGLARQMHNADGHDPAFDRMILLGHSMGGLLSHTMAVASGDQLWRLYTDRSFDEMIGPREVLSELQRYLFFEPLPFVSRVVFLATPHRGSDLSRGMVGRVSTSLISDPDYIHKLLYRIVKDNPDAFDSRRFRRFPSSIETLTTDSPILTAFLNMKPRPGVEFHSIIGSYRPTGVDQSTDGVVPYRSAHLDGVASEKVVSEKVVRSDHGVQKDPEAIIEVRRILHLHLGVDAASPASRSSLGSGPEPVTLGQPIPVR